MNTVELDSLLETRLTSHLEGKVEALTVRLANAERDLRMMCRNASRNGARADILEAACRAALDAQMHPGSRVSIRLAAALKMAEEL